MAAQQTQRLVRRKTRMERTRDRVTWRLACALALVVKPFAQRIWPLAMPVQVALALMARGYSWDAAISEVIALPALPALPDTRAPESLGWRVDIAVDHWGDLHYTAVARTPQDTRPTLETLAETRATSPIARMGGVDVRYRRLIEDDPACELLAVFADLPTAPSLPAVKPAAVATDTSAEWRPASAGSLSIASLIDADAKRRVEDLLCGARQPATQPLTGSVRQQRRQAQQTQQAPVPPLIVPVLTPTATTTPATIIITPTTTPEREETPTTC